MFKRSTKITSLLVAAASMVSMVPVMAADAKTINSEEGTIFNAVAFKDGKFFIDGEVDGKDGNVYFYNGKYNELENIDSGDKTEVYGEKYLKVDDGDYYVDLTSGKVTDDDLSDDDLDDAKSELRKKLKKDNDGRYDKEVETSLAESLKAVEAKNFGEDFYEVDLKAKSKATANNNADEFHVYTDKAGKYIDADYNLGKIQVSTTDAAGKIVDVTIKNTSDDDKGIRASITHKETIGQDANYIYRTAYLKIFADNNGVLEDRTAVAKFGGKENTVESDSNGILVIQKIAKAQASDDVDGAKTSKSVTTYFVTGDKGGDAKELYKNFAINNGKVITYERIGDDGVQAKAITLKSTNGYYYTDFSDGIKETDDVKAIDVDVDGNLWVLQKGSIKKFDNDEDLDKVYKVDGAMDRLSVYDKNNMIVWNEDDEVYSIISEKAKAEEEKPVEETPAVKAGWNQAADGTWTFLNADGSKVTGWYNDNGTWYFLDGATGVMKTGWYNDNGTWYYLAASGAMQTGWYNDNGTWYYLAASGAMQTGWINDNGTWYYCNASGAMLASTVVDGYVLGANGAWIR